MCRIAGIITRQPNEGSSAALKRMLAQLAHGGPDDEGIYSDGNLTFGHRRLSIIDLSSAGHQPMRSTEDHYIISYNGEIFNYQELKAELLSDGVSFATATDTEVIIRVYEKWGASGFARLRGMFAFSFFDRLKNKVLLVRDAVGIKPLYYFKNADTLIFASEVKAFRAYDERWKQSDNWPIFFLAFGSIPFPYTTLNDVYQLRGGSFLELDLNNFSVVQMSFKSLPVGTAMITDAKQAIGNVYGQMNEALKRHLLSDAPLGVFLSGGIDSSLLTIMADKEVNHELQAVSVNFKEATYDERAFQQIALSRTNHTHQNSYEVGESMFWEHLDDIWNAMDQPSIDGVNSYFVSYFARRAGLKAVLSGLGADELFGGYASFSRISIARFLRILPFKNMFAAVAGQIREQYKRISFLTVPGAIGDYLFLRGLFTPDQIASVLNIELTEVLRVLNTVSVNVPDNLSDKEYASFLESEIYMKNQLLKDTDFMSMWHALEVRVPFLDEDLIATVETIPSDIRYQNDRPKFLLTTAFKDQLPHEIIFRRKTGFTFPFSLWLKNSPQRSGQIFPKGEEAGKVKSQFMAGKTHWSKYWSLIVMQNFRDRVAQPMTTVQQKHVAAFALLCGIFVNLPVA